MPREGDEFAGHRIECLLGRGGMGVVYLAEHIHLSHRRALKILAPELATDETFRQRFIRESRLAAKVEHHNIVPIYDAGESGGLLYIAMRYVEGTDLEALLRDRGRLSPHDTVSILAQVGGALDAAHAASLVHRDVKPANILIAQARREKGRVFLTDFGLTKRMDSRSRLTQTGLFLGTLDYVAPEQTLGQDIDGRADVYSLGCVLYRCLTNEVPFPRNLQTAVIAAHLMSERPKPSSLAPGLPREWDGVVAKAIAKNREERYGTCSELIEAATDVLRPSEGRATTVKRASPTSGPSLPTVLQPAARGSRTQAPVEDGPASEPRHGPPELAQSPGEVGADRSRRQRLRVWGAILIGGLLLGGLLTALLPRMLSEPGIEPSERPDSNRAPAPLARSGRIAYLEGPESKPSLQVVALPFESSPGQEALSQGEEMLRPDWSPNGRWIVFAAREQGSDLDIWAIDSDAGQRDLVVDTPADEYAPDWAPSGRELAFSSNLEGVYDIYVSSRDGGELRNLTNSDAQDTAPDWRRDGARLVFASKPRGGDYDLWIVPAETGPPRRLLEHPGDDQSPAWSPDGSKIVFDSNVDGDYDIWVANADGTNPHPLTDNEVDDRDPAWAMGGSVILFTTLRGGDSDIYEMTPAGKRVSPITPSAADEYNVSWTKRISD
jgi:serine/threonine protein kinase